MSSLGDCGQRVSILINIHDHFGDIGCLGIHGVDDGNDILLDDSVSAFVNMASPYFGVSLLEILGCGWEEEVGPL